jgi:hypothetical protein
MFIYTVWEVECSNMTEVRISSESILGCKGKSIPLEALTGPEGSRRLRLPDFMTIGT